MNRVLLIEDEPDLYEILKSRLEREGYVIVKDDYDIVVLDYSSKDYKLFDKNKLIIISGLNIQLKGYNFLMKPFRTECLISMIKKIQKT